jgi:hypothetical protein
LNIKEVINIEKTKIKKDDKKKKIIREKIRKRAPRKISNVFNIGAYIRSKTKLKVSPSFVDEIMSRTKEQLEVDVEEAEQIANSMGMKTLMEIHAIRIYDYRIPDHCKIISCDSCGNSFTVSAEKASKKLICPFCGQKRYITFE